MDNTTERILAYHNLLNLLKNDNAMTKEESKDDKTFRNSTTKQISDRDENITQIILHTQEHDTSGRKWAMEFKNLVDNLDKKDKR